MRAAIPVNYLTAYHSMFAMGNLRPGDRILIHGAAAALELPRCNWHGTRARDFRYRWTDEAGILRKIGVDHAIDYEKGRLS